MGVVALGEKKKAS